MRIVSIILVLLLASCGENTADRSSETDVTISLVSQTATGAIGAVGDIPLRVQSIRITAINASGNIIAGPVIANRPTLAAVIRIPNGNNIRIRIAAYDALNAQGTIIYETLSKPINLTGVPVTLPVVMSLSVAVTANTTSVLRLNTVNLTGTVSGNTPPPTSPLVWTKTGGTFTVVDAYGAARTWQAPNTPGQYTIAAHVDPTKNPDQDPNIIGSVKINVINRDPYVSTFNSAPIDVYAGTTALFPLITAGDLDGDTLTAATQGAPTWVSLVSSGLNPLSVGLGLQPPSGTNGQFTFQVGITDGFGGNISKSITVSVNSSLPAPVINVFNPLSYTPSIDISGYALIGSTVDLYANGNIFIASVTPGTFSEFTFIPNMGDFFYTATGIPNGAHTITAYTRIGNNISVASNTVNIIINSLLGTGVSSTNPIAANPTSIAATDLNNDFYADIILGDSAGNVYIYPGDGTSNIVNTALAPIATSAAGMNQFAVGDLNADGYTDVVLPSQTNDTVSILAGNGTGLVPFGQAIPVDLYAAPTAVAIADLNNDGYADILTANNGPVLGLGADKTVSTLSGTGAGFQLDPYVTTITGMTALNSITTADFNVDGYTDVALAGSSLAVAINNPALGAPTITPYPTQTPVHVTTGFLNGDGFPDIVSCTSNSSITVLLSGLGGFPNSSTYFLPFGSIPKWAAIGDMNGDFFDDIVVAASGTNTITILINDGLGNFSTSVNYPTVGIDPSSIALHDINGDSQLDVIVANGTSKDISVIPNTSLPPFFGPPGNALGRWR